jgi:hypothetical protein
MANAYINEDEGFGIKLGQAVTVGDLVAVHTDGLGYLANAKVGEDLQIPCAGIAETTGAIGDTVELKRNGTMAYSTGGLTIGAQIYLAETDGAITQTAPSDSGDCVQCVGVAIAADAWKIELDCAVIV